MNNTKDSTQTQLAAACILLSVADADELLEDQELDTINTILQDFFTLDGKTASSLMEKAKSKLYDSTGLFQFGSQLNDDFSHNDKIDFISCVFEVAFTDGELHYLEHHTIKNIANILNLSRDEIINAKAEIENFLD